MRDWQEWDGQYTANVYDKDYVEPLALLFDSKKSLLRVEDVTLDEKGIVKLRKKLQQVERYLKDNRPASSAAFTELLDSPELAQMLDGYEVHVQTDADGLNEGEELQ